MLTGNLIHPEIIAELALCGHGSKILIADGNYPLANRTGAAKKVFLGLSPDLPKVTDVLSALTTMMNVETAEVMQPEDGSTPEIYNDFNQLLGDVPLTTLGRYEFYDACCEPVVMLAISTGEKRIFANILLTVGVS